MASKRPHSSDWRQGDDQTNPASLRVLGVALLVGFTIGVVAFLIWLMPEAPPRLYVESLAMVGYSDRSDSRAVAHLPPIRDAVPSAERLQQAILRGVPDASLLTETPSTPDLSQSLDTLSIAQRQADDAEPATDLDVHLIYVVGHAGVAPGLEETNDVRLLTSEYDAKSMEGRSVSLGEALEAYCESRQGTKVLLLDVFRLGIDPWLGSYDLTLPEQVEEVVERLGRDDLWVVLACSKGQRSGLSRAIGSGRAPRSIFEAVVSDVFSGGLFCPDGALTVESAFGGIQRGVVQVSGGLQRPRLIHSGGSPEGANKVVLSATPVAREEASEDADTDGSVDREPSDRSAGLDDEVEFSPLAKDPWLRMATYAPVYFRAGLLEPSGADSSDHLATARKVERRAKAPRWEDWSDDAQRRRQAIDQHLLGLTYAEAYVRLVAALDGAHSDVPQLEGKVGALISALEKQKEWLLTGRNAPPSAEVDDRHDAIRYQLLSMADAELKQLRFESGRGKWDYPAERVVTAILESRVLGDGPTTKRVAEFEAVLGRAPKGSLLVTPIDEESSTDTTRSLGEDRLLGLFRSLYQLAGLPHDASGDAAREELTKWLHRQVAPSPENLRFEDRVVAQLADTRSFGRKDTWDSRYSSPFVLPADTYIRVGDSVEIAPADGASAEVVCNDDGVGTLALRLRFLGDRVDTDTPVWLHATYDDTLLEVREREGKLLELEKGPEFTPGEAYERERVAMVARFPRPELAPPEPMKVRIAAVDRNGDELGALDLRVFSKQASRVEVAVEQRRYGADGWRWTDARSGSVGAYPDMPNKFRFTLTNLRAERADLGAVVYAVPEGGGTSGVDLEGEKPLAVGYLTDAEPDVASVVSFAPIPGPPVESDDPDAAAAQPESPLLGKLRGYELAEPQLPYRQLVVRVLDDQGEQVQRFHFRSQLLSPSDYIDAAALDYDEDPLVQRGTITLRPRTDVLRPGPLPSEGAKNAIIASVKYSARDTEPDGAIDGPQALVLRETEPVDARFTVLPSLPELRPTPLLHVDIGSYPWAKTLELDPSRREWLALREKLVDFIGVVAGDDRKRLPLERGVYLLESGVQGVQAEFGCAYGDDPSAVTRWEVIDTTNNDEVVARGGSQSPRTYTTAVERLDNEVFDLGVTCHHLSVPIGSERTGAVDSNGSYRVRAVAQVVSDSDGASARDESPLIILDKTPPRLPRGGKPTFSQREIVAGAVDRISVQFGVEEQHSGVAKVIYLWEAVEGESNPAEKKFNLDNPIGKISRPPDRFEALVGALKPGRYRLLMKLEDHAENRSTQWAESEPLVVSAPVDLSEPPPPRLKPKPKLAPKPKPKPVPLGITVKLLHPNGAPMSDPDFDVSISGPGSPRIVHDAGPYWKASGLDASGEYDIRASGSINGNRHRGGAEGVKPSPRGADQTPITLEKG